MRVGMLVARVRRRVMSMALRVFTLAFVSVVPLVCGRRGRCVTMVWRVFIASLRRSFVSRVVRVGRLLWLPSLVTASLLCLPFSHTLLVTLRIRCDDGSRTETLMPMQALRGRRAIGTSWRWIRVMRVRRSILRLSMCWRRWWRIVALGTAGRQSIKR